MLHFSGEVRRRTDCFTLVLTLLVEYSLLPHIFVFKSPSNFFCLDLKVIILTFLYIE